MFGSPAEPGASPLEELRGKVEGCAKCELARTRTNLVFGVGNPHARAMFVGEAPGKHEDLQGEPFVGAAGKLLDELLAHVGFSREDVYIANVLKCRPPGNRDPEPEEIETCVPYLREQIRLIDPEVLVTLGNFATKLVLKTTFGITRLRGTVQQAGRFTVLPIYHPAAALYDGTKRDILFSDFERLAQLMLPTVGEEEGSVLGSSVHEGGFPGGDPAGGNPAEDAALDASVQEVLF
ncbi:MAG: uracil-DNA glycosylase [Coriobacteriia bacterium]|nr:uracil-DNA glycosylase [Coriobacteriia bacterium]